jgi:hypothetical protein
MSAAAGAPPVASYSGETIAERVASKNEALRRLDRMLETKPPQDTEVDAVIKAAEDATAAMAAANEEAGLGEAEGGGRRRRKLKQKGGDETRAEKIAFVKAVGMMVLYNSGQLVVATGRPTKDYLVREIVKPLLGTTSRLAGIALALAQELVVRAPVTAAILSGSGIGFTANLATQLIQKFNTWGRVTAADLLSAEKAAEAADIAVKDVASVVKTTAVGFFALNQLGVAPLSAVLASILYSLKITATTGVGRAYFVSSFYAWYVTQPKANQAVIDKAVVGYAAKVKGAAGQGADAVRAAAAEAIGSLAPMLVAEATEEPANKPEGSVSVAGKNAFQVIAEAKAALEAAAPAAAPAKDKEEAATALTNGAPAAAVAVDQAEKEAAAAAAAPVVESNVDTPYGPLPSYVNAPEVAGPPAPGAAEGEAGLVSGRPDKVARQRGRLTAERAAQAEPTPRRAARLKKTEGGRKTRGKKSKRRVTRRKSRKATTVKFAY